MQSGFGRSFIATSIRANHSLFWLHHAHAVAFRVEKRDVKAVTGYLHWLAKNFAAHFHNFLHGLLNITHADYDGRILCRHISRFLVKTTVDGSRVFRTTVLVGLRGSNEHILVHVGAEHLRLPAECFCVKIRHAVFIFRRHFKVDYWIHCFSPYQLRVFLYFWGDSLRRRNSAAVRGSEPLLYSQLSPLNPQLS